MTFEEGQRVRLRTDVSLEGIVTSIGPCQGPVQFYGVFWGGVRGEELVDQASLIPASQPSELIGGYSDLLRALTLEQLRGQRRLYEHVYAFNASRTLLLEYQYKPLLKLLDSPHQRLLIADEVGLGKTIEAGIILTELRAREDVRRVLVVCPSPLCQKWKTELRDRFGMEFGILRSEDIRDWLESYMEGGRLDKLSGIVSLATVRQPSVQQALAAAMPDLDLVIVDEAHHMRNRTKTREAGVLLSASASWMVMLSATPVQLGVEDLYSILKVLAPNEFPDEASADLLFRANQPIVQACNRLSKRDSSPGDLLPYLEEALRHQANCHSQLLINIRDRVSSMTSFAPDSRATLQRDLENANLLGSILTRTRKSSVQETAIRSPHALCISFSETELRVYDAATTYVRSVALASGTVGIPIQWIVNSPQRRLASCLPAMVDHLESSLQDVQGAAMDESGDDSADEEASEPSPQAIFDAKWQRKVASDRLALEHAIGAWRASNEDSKYDGFLDALQRITHEQGEVLILVFAFYKATLRYLKGRLAESGISSEIISGDVAIEDRRHVIKAFQSGEFRVLLSSRVGSEGLDFMFCHVMFNYDLPWNPMEVEQRIGRLDRIGQQSEKILIYNLWVNDTIEARILERLYERVGVFERSIGSLEGILGEIVAELERESLTRDLSPADVDAKLHQRLGVQAGQRVTEELLREKIPDLVGADAYYEERVSDIRRKRLYISGEQLYRFVAEFLRKFAPATRLMQEAKQGVFLFEAGNDLKELLLGSTQFPEVSRLLHGGRHRFTFDSGVAFRDSRLELLSINHPLVTSIVDAYQRLGGERIRKGAISLESDKLPRGVYCMYCLAVTLSAIRERHMIETVVLSSAGAEACSRSEAAELLGLLLAVGRPSEFTPADPIKGLLASQSRVAQSLIRQRALRLKDEMEMANDVHLDRMMASVMAVSERRRVTLLRARDTIRNRDDSSKKAESYLKGIETKLQNLELETQHKVADLEGRRLVSLAISEAPVFEAILEVTHE